MTTLETQRKRAQALVTLIEDAQGALDPTSSWYAKSEKSRQEARQDLEFLESQLSTLIDTVCRAAIGK